MTNSKGTKGKWSVSMQSDIFILPENMLNRAICLVYPRDSEPESTEAIANAKLIASAPELLEALKGSLQILEQTLTYRNANSITMGNIFLESVIEQSKKVIEKATGQEKSNTYSVIATKDKTIDTDNIRLHVVVSVGIRKFATYFQYIISSNSAHNSDVEFEKIMEMEGISVDQIRDDIESRKIQII